MTVSINIHVSSSNEESVDINIIPTKTPVKVERTLPKETASFLGLDPAIPITEKLKLSPAEEQALLEMDASELATTQQQELTPAEKSEDATTAAQRLMNDPTMHANRKMRDEAVENPTMVGFK